MFLFFHLLFNPFYERCPYRFPIIGILMFLKIVSDFFFSWL